MRQSIHKNGDHPDIAVSMNNLATVLIHLGDYKEAMSLQKDALAMYQRIFGLGVDHPSIATTMINLANTCGEDGDIDDSPQARLPEKNGNAQSKWKNKSSEASRYWLVSSTCPCRVPSLFRGRRTWPQALGIRRPRFPGLEACGSMGKLVLFLVSSSGFYGGGGGGLMVVPRVQKISLDCGREHENEVRGRSGAFGGLVGLPGGPVGCFLVSRGSFWGAFWSPGEPLEVDFAPLGSLRDHCWVTFSICSPRLLPILQNALRFLRNTLFKGVDAPMLGNFCKRLKTLYDFFGRIFFKGVNGLVSDNFWRFL